MEETRELLAAAYGPGRLDNIPLYVRKIGSRSEVWRGIAEKTKGGLRRSDLKEKVCRVDAKTGRECTRLVSKRASETAARNNNLGLKPKPE